MKIINDFHSKDCFRTIKSYKLCNFSLDNRLQSIVKNLTIEIIQMIQSIIFIENPYRKTVLYKHDFTVHSNILFIFMLIISVVAFIFSA